MYRYREFWMVETERLTVSEWTSEGSLERLWIVSVGADGTPPVIHRGTYDGTCKRVDIFHEMSIWVVSQKFTLLSHVWGQRRFLVSGDSNSVRQVSKTPSHARWQGKATEMVTDTFFTLLRQGRRLICHPKQGFNHQE